MRLELYGDSILGFRMPQTVVLAMAGTVKRANAQLVIVIALDSVLKR